MGNDPFVLSLLALVAVLVGLGAPVVGIYAARAPWARYQRIKNTKTSRIGMLRPGIFEVKGRVVMPEAPLVSPMNAIPCVYYRFAVREKITRTRKTGYGKNRRRRTTSEWITIIDDADAVPCFLDDGTGKVEVPIMDAELHLKRDASASSGFLNEASDELKATLRGRYGKDTQGLVFNKSLRYEETVVITDDELYVLGEVGRDKDGVSFRRGSDDRPDTKLLVSDRSETALSQMYLSHAIGAVGLGVLIAAGVVAAGVALFMNAA